MNATLKVERKRDGETFFFEDWEAAHKFCNETNSKKMFGHNAPTHEQLFGASIVEPANSRPKTNGEEK